MTCAGDNGDCPRPVEKGGLCAGHRKRRARGLSIDEPLRSYADPWRAVSEAWRRYWECDSADDAEFERAKAATRMAMNRYADRK